MLRAEPHGFHPHASGLIVPEALARVREVWTPAEFKILQRATKLLASYQVEVYFGCPEPDCKTQPLERVTNGDGGFTLRCAHKDRIFTRVL